MQSRKFVKNSLRDLFEEILQVCRQTQVDPAATSKRCSVTGDVLGRHRDKYAATAVEHESVFAGDPDEGISLDEQLPAGWRHSLAGKSREKLKRTESETCKDWQTCFSVRSEDRPLRSADPVAFVNQVAARERAGTSRTEAFCGNFNIA
jgi:hypothetical protein